MGPGRKGFGPSPDGWVGLHGEVVLELSLTGCVGVFQKEEGRGKAIPEREKPEIRQWFCRAHRK